MVLPGVVVDHVQPLTHLALHVSGGVGMGAPQHPARVPVLGPDHAALVRVTDERGARCGLVHALPAPPQLRVVPPVEGVAPAPRRSGPLARLALHPDAVLFRALLAESRRLVLRHAGGAAVRSAWPVGELSRAVRHEGGDSERVVGLAQREALPAPGRRPAGGGQRLRTCEHVRRTLVSLRTPVVARSRRVRPGTAQSGVRAEKVVPSAPPCAGGQSGGGVALLHHGEPQGHGHGSAQLPRRLGDGGAGGHCASVARPEVRRLRGRLAAARLRVTAQPVAELILGHFQPAHAAPRPAPGETERTVFGFVRHAPRARRVGRLCFLDPGRRKVATRRASTGLAHFPDGVDSGRTLHEEKGKERLPP